MYRLVAILLAVFVYHASAQSVSVYNAQTVFRGAALQLYSRTDTLSPNQPIYYDLQVPANYSNPDLLLTLNSTSGGTGLGLYCSRKGIQPQPGLALWNSDLSTPVNQIYVSHNDIFYSQIIQRGTSSPALTCSVRNSDQNETNTFTFAMSVISANSSLAAAEQVLLANLYSRCCTQTGSCSAWKTLTNAQSSQTNANGGMIRTDFCSFPGQICTPTGNLYRLDLSGYNMSCPWPNDIFSQFSQLTTLFTRGNSYSGNTSAVGQTFNALKNLQIFDGTGSTGLTGGYDSGDAQTGLCNAAQRSLISLTMTQMNVSGSIPNCLYSGASNLFVLALDQNRLSGTLRDTIPTNSSLEAIVLTTNSLSGSLPASLGNAKRLLFADFSENAFTGSIPSSLGSLRAMYSFSVRQNQLTGAIPDSFGTTNNLQIFDAKLNQLTSLPAAWLDSNFNATNSSYVNIRASMNQISGSFPAGLVYAPYLRYLVLNENNISGPLPTKDGMFPSMRAFNVSTNKLSGSIPVQWNQSAAFSQNGLPLANGQPFAQVFDLSYNRFTGSLPSFMSKGKLPSWVYNGIYLQGNNLNVSCQDNNFNYISSICAQGAQSSSNQQSNSTAAPPTSPVTSITRPANSTATPSSPFNSATTVTASSDRLPQRRHHGLSGGAIAGIVIGSVAGLLLVGALAAFAVIAIRRRRSGVTMGELGRSISLNRGLTSKSSTGSAMGERGIGKFQQFVDSEGQKSVELSPSK